MHSIEKQVHQYSTEYVSIYLHRLINFEPIQVASFLHRELPIRLAHRVRDLESVPDMLAQKSVQQASLRSALIFRQRPSTVVELQFNSVF